MLVETEHPRGRASHRQEGSFVQPASSDLTGPLLVVLPAAMEALPAGVVASFPAERAIEASGE